MTADAAPDVWRRTRAIRWLRDAGLALLPLIPRLRERVLDQYQPTSPASYRRWIARYETPKQALAAAIAARRDALPPLRFLVVLDCRGPAPGFARRIESVRRQSYARWQAAVLAGPDATTADLATADLATADAAQDAGITVVRGLAALADLLGSTDAGHTLWLPPGRSLAPAALFELACLLAAGPATDIIYTDEDSIDAAGRRHAPIFRTAWSVDLLHARDCALSPLVLRTTLLRRLVPMLGETGGVFELALRASEAVPVSRIAHLPEVLSHRDATAAQPPTLRRVIHDLPVRPPLVSLIVPTRDHAHLLRTCATGLLERTSYAPLELIVADNGSEQADTLALFSELAEDPRVRVLPCPGAFNFSRINNQAAGAARGRVLVFVNNDIEVIAPDWLSEMVAQVLRPDVGIVGAKLLYRDGRLQHGGVALGVGGIASHLEQGAPRDAPGYAGRLAMVRDVAAVTGACLAVRRDVFDRAGRWNERDLAVAYNDIDLCLRVRALGYRVLWTPFAVLYHDESASRRSDFDAAELPRYRREVDYMRSRWGSQLAHDPYYGPHHALRDGDYTLARPRRRPPWQRALNVVYRTRS